MRVIYVEINIYLSCITRCSDNSKRAFCAIEKDIRIGDNNRRSSVCPVPRCRRERYEKGKKKKSDEIRGTRN